jgi:hypothetical protein
MFFLSWFSKQQAIILPVWSGLVMAYVVWVYHSECDRLRTWLNIERKYVFERPRWTSLARSLAQISGLCVSVGFGLFVNYYKLFQRWVSYYFFFLMLYVGVLILLHICVGKKGTSRLRRGLHRIIVFFAGSLSLAGLIVTIYYIRGHLII